MEASPGLSAPAQPNETIVIYTVGFGFPRNQGALSTPPSITIGGAPAAVLFNNALTATYGGLVTPSGDLITVRR